MRKEGALALGYTKTFEVLADRSVGERILPA